ncbi:MAG: zinc-binding dehydrogenase [bacterium]|nr:zinc-binding dehydrogenase [bacterium]
MISQTYRLFSPRQIRVDQIDEKIGPDDIIVRPTYLSICAADQRYYMGKRDKTVLAKKLPMALIHESVGKVVYDPKGIISKGTNVVMIPNTPIETDKVIKENYLRSSYFKSSGYDGFMRSIVVIDRNRIIPYENIEERTAVLLELMSVAMNALEHFDKYSHMKKQTIGVWGDGSVGFVTSLVLKYVFPNAKIAVMGTTHEKLNYFRFADETHLINEIPKDFSVDHAFECVGGQYSGDAINQIIDYINPEGSIGLMGVSEMNVPINTRMILEKGLTILGNSRSGYEDFKSSIDFLNEHPDAKTYLSTIISDEVVVKKLNDINTAFQIDLDNDFKTIMKWDI